MEEISKFLDAHDLTILNQEDINNLNRYIKNSEIEVVIKNFLTKTDSLLNSTRPLKNR
jgi:hypothetical protein